MSLESIARSSEPSERRGEGWWEAVHREEEPKAPSVRRYDAAWAFQTLKDGESATQQQRADAEQAKHACLAVSLNASSHLPPAKSALWVIHEPFAESHSSARTPAGPSMPPTTSQHCQRRGRVYATIETTPPLALIFASARRET